MINYLEKLLDGQKVEWRKLGEVAEFSNTGVDKKLKANEQKVRLLNFVDVFQNQYINNQTPTMIVTAPDKKISNCNILKGDVFITPSSEIIDEIGQSAMAVEDFDNAVYSYHIMRLRIFNKELLQPEFLNYLFQSDFLRRQIKLNAQGITRFGLTQPKWKSLQIPIPPLSVQKEIVKILDKMTELEAMLEAMLEAELTLRRKQYDYYRNALLDFNNQSGGVIAKFYSGSLKNVEWKTLGDIGEVRMCKRILKEQTADIGDIPFYKIGTFGKEANAFISRELFDKYKSKYPYPKLGDILISASGTIGRTVIFDGQDAYFQDSNIVWIENDEKQVLNKYLFYFYQVANWNIAEGGTIQRLYNDNLRKVKIPIPPLEVQNKIVTILDKFDTLTQSISEGLPHEIALRRKQYEYYREQLLNFPKP